MRSGIRSGVFAAILATTVAPPAGAADAAAEARAALQPVLVKLVATARDENASPEAKRALIEHELAIWIDYGQMSKVALGTQAEKFSKQQVTEFSQEFERYLSDVYIRRIARFREKEIEIKEASLDAKTGVVTIHTLGGVPLGPYKVVSPRHKENTRADVEYLLRRKGSGDWRILAIRIDGVDLARNFRDQFQAVLERSDPDALIAELRKRNAEREAQNPWQ